MQFHLKVGLITPKGGNIYTFFDFPPCPWKFPPRVELIHHLLLQCSDQFDESRKSIASSDARVRHSQFR
jgi:hypothetical protein